MNTHGVEERGVIGVQGTDASAFLHNLLTNDILGLQDGQARYAALLTPQGKIISDFIVFTISRDGTRDYILDTPRQRVDDAVQRLRRYKLRSHVAIEDLSANLHVVHAPSRSEAPKALIVAPDPRAPGLGWRGITPEQSSGDQENWCDFEERRIAACVPSGGVDFAFEQTFPHEANMDRLNGIDFKKGCYVGQEIVARMHYRATTRRRVARWRVEGPEIPLPGTPIFGGDVEIGTIGSFAGSQGLALVRRDRLLETQAAAKAIQAGGIEVAIEVDDAAT